MSSREPQPELSADRAAHGSCAGPGIAAGRGGGARLYLAAFAAALVLYVATLAPDLVWQDGGEYQWTAARLSWPPAIHPEGRPSEFTVWCRPGEAVRVHPLFLVAAHALGRLNLWNYAYAANLCSALFAALAAANVVLLVFLMTGRRDAAVVAGAAFALGHAVWTFAVTSEVLGSAAMLLSAECLCAWGWATRRQARWLLALFFLNGIAISNHMMASLGLAVFGVWLLVEVVRRRAPAWVMPAAAGLWLAGGTLYWIVVGLEYVRTGNVAETLVSATVGGFGGAAGNLAGLPRLFARSLLYVGLNHPTPLALAAIPGALSLVRRRDGFARVLLALAAVFFLWAARYDVPDQYSFFVPFYVLSSVLIGLGAAWFVARPGRWRLPALLVLAALPVAVYAVLPSVARQAGLRFFKREVPYRDPYVYFLRPWKCGDWGARRFAEQTLDSLPRGAMILPDTTTSPPLKCLHDVERLRPDVLIVDPYDARFYPSLSGYWQAKEAPADLMRHGRRVFVVSDSDGYLPKWAAAGPWRLKPYGCIRELEPESKEGGP